MVKTNDSDDYNKYNFAICFLFYKWESGWGGEFIFYIIIRYGLEKCI